MSNGPEKPPTAPAAIQYPGFLTVFPSIMLPMFLAIVDQTIVATALPAIAAEMGQVERMSWIVVSYLIAATIAAPLYGRLGDAFGRRRLMFTAIGLFVVASLLCALAPTVELLTAARLLQGFGGGGLMTLSQALVGEAIPPRERARYQGYIATVAVCANTFGPVAGGLLTEYFGWRSIFFVGAPIGILAFALTLRLPNRVPETREWKRDPVGLGLFAVFVATSLLGLEQAQHLGRDAFPLGGSLLALGVIALVLLIRHENRMPSPFIPIHMLRKPGIWQSDGMAACNGATVVGLITFFPIYLQVVHGASPSAVGLLLVPLMIGISSSSLITGRIVARTGYTMIFPMFGFPACALFLFVLAFFGDVMGTQGLAFVMLGIGASLGTVMGQVQLTVQSASGMARLGEGAATVQFSRSIGAAFGTALMAMTLFGVLAFRSPEAAGYFADIVEHARPGAITPAPAQLAAVQADIAFAFRAAFALVGVYAVIGFLFTLANPLRRIA
ncbi:MAG: MFS transporter [Pseudorhodoplanes sp.]